MISGLQCIQCLPRAMLQIILESSFHLSLSLAILLSLVKSSVVLTVYFQIMFPTCSLRQCQNVIIYHWQCASLVSSFVLLADLISVQPYSSNLSSPVSYQSQGRTDTFVLGGRYGSEKARRAWPGLEWVQSLGKKFKL